MTKYMAYFLKKLDGATSLWGWSSLGYMIGMYVFCNSNMLIWSSIFWMSALALNFVVVTFICAYSIRYMEQEKIWYLNPRNLDDIQTVKKDNENIS